MAAGREVRERDGQRAALAERVVGGRVCGDRTPDRTQRLLNRASWDEMAAMSLVRRHAVAGLDQALAATPRGRWRSGRWTRRARRSRARVPPGSSASTWAAPAGSPTASTPSTCPTSGTRPGHALIGARQWIPAEQVKDPVTSLITGLPLDLRFRTKGQLAIDIFADAYADGLFSTSSAAMRSTAPARSCGSSWKQRGQGYVLRVAPGSRSRSAAGIKMTCARRREDAAEGHARWEVRSAGKGPRASAGTPGPDRHRLSPPLPAHPPASEDRRAGLSLLLRAGRAACWPEPG